jgi:hypothetical protein
MVTGVGNCSAAETEAVKNAFLEFLSNPKTSHGVYTPGVKVDTGSQLHCGRRLPGKLLHSPTSFKLVGELVGGLVATKFVGTSKLGYKLTWLQASFRDKKQNTNMKSNAR